MKRTNKSPATGDGGAEGDHSKNTPPNKSPNSKAQAWKAAAVSTLAILREHFPSCFAPQSQRLKWPIAVGIHIDIAAALPELPAVNVRRALRFYTSDIKYLSSCTEGKYRIGLNGVRAGIITQAEAEHAAELISKRRRKKPQAEPPSPPKKLSLADLKAAAARKRAAAAGAAP